MKTNTIAAMHEIRLMIAQIVIPVTLIVTGAVYALNFTESGKEFKNNIRCKIESKRAERKIKQQKKI